MLYVYKNADFERDTAHDEASNRRPMINFIKTVADCFQLSRRIVNVS